MTRLLIEIPDRLPPHQAGALCNDLTVALSDRFGLLADVRRVHDEVPLADHEKVALVCALDLVLGVTGDGLTGESESVVRGLRARIRESLR